MVSYQCLTHIEMLHQLHKWNICAEAIFN